MTVLTQINGGSTPSNGLDIRETLNAMLTDVAALKTKVAAIPPLASFGVATLSQNEGNSGASAFVFPVNLDKVWATDTVYEYVTAAIGSNPADAADFVGGAFPRGLVTIPAGSTTANVSIPVVGDTTIEPNENFAVRLYRVAASSLGTILNDDTLNALTVSKTTGNVGTALSSTISGLSPNTTLVLTGTGSAGLVISGAVINGTPTAAGPVNIVETPAGGGTSRTTNGAITISAVAGSVAPSVPIAPSLRFHPNTATNTMRADSTVQGYITNGILTVTTWAAATSEGLRPDEITPMYIQGSGVPAGTKIMGLGGGTGFGQGKTGTYCTNGTATVGSSSDIRTFTIPARRVIAANDLTGNSTGLSSPDNSGPVLTTDGHGRKCWMFDGNVQSLRAWLQNNTYTGIDTLNFTWVIVGCMLDHAQTNGFLPAINPIAAVGYPGSGVSDAYTGQYPARLNWNLGAVIGNGNMHGQKDTADLNVQKRMTLGMQPQVFSSGAATADGYNGTSLSTTAFVAINEQISTKTYTAPAQARKKNYTGFVINAEGDGNVPSESGHRGCLMLIYDIIGYARGELGNASQIAANVQTVHSALMTGWNIPVITKSATALGDSRFAQSGSYYMPNTGYSIAGYLCLPGPDALPSNVRVTSWPVSGQGVGMMAIHANHNSIPRKYGFASPLASAMMLGGGNDYFFFLSGSNDTGGGTLWPETAGAKGSNAYVDDLYSGNVTSTFDATVAVDNTIMTKANQTGPTPQGSIITSTNAPWDPGQAIFDDQSGSTTQAKVSVYPSSAITAVSTTTRLDGYIPFVRKLFARGLKGLWLTEPGKKTGTYLSQKVESTGLVDTGAAPGGTYQGQLRILSPTPITVAGKAVFGADVIDYSQYFADFIHYTEAGKMALVTGGDDQTKGLRYNLKQFIAA